MKPTVLAEAVMKELRAFEQAMTDDRIVLERRQDGQLWAVKRGEARPVSVRRCFPWSEPGDYVSLRDGDEAEFALISDPAELDETSRQILGQALAEAGFVLEITAIKDVDEEVEIRTWKVETRQGERSLQTRLDDWPMEVPGGGIVIQDVAGDLYHVADPDDMDERSRRWLWAFVD